MKRVKASHADRGCYAYPQAEGWEPFPLLTFSKANVTSSLSGRVPAHSFPVRTK